MAQISIINKSELEGASRIDAEYYQPKYLKFSKRLFQIGELPLGKLAFITDGQHGYHKVDPLSNIRHITAKNIKLWVVNDENADRLAEETNQKNKRSVLEKDDILISTAGTIGVAGIVPDDILPANIDQDVARVHILNKERLDPYFLIAFLHSKYGQFQIQRETTGQVQTHLALEKIKNNIYVSIPKCQSKISTIVRNAINKLCFSKTFYFQAEQLLLEELKINKLDFKNDKPYCTVSASKAVAENRLDAEYYQLKYDKLVNSLGKNKRTLGSLVKINNKKTKVFPDDNYCYIEISDVNVGNADVEFNTMLGKELPANAKLKIDGGELIVSKVRPTRGAVAIIPESYNHGFIASGAFSRIEVASPLREYLQVVIRSVIGKLQLEKPTTGTSYPTVIDADVDKLIIPILPVTFQKQIADLVQESHEARKEAKSLLAQAIQKVEDMIEQT